MVLSDIGAENAMHYGGDLTRTFPVGRSFTSRQKEIYVIVLTAITHAIGMLNPGVKYKDIHLSAAKNWPKA
jgi:Xaa-Pro aminopeptidase